MCADPESAVRRGCPVFEIVPALETGYGPIRDFVMNVARFTEALGSLAIKIGEHFLAGRIGATLSPGAAFL